MCFDGFNKDTHRGSDRFGRNVFLQFRFALQFYTHLILLVSNDKSILYTVLVYAKTELSHPLDSAIITNGLSFIGRFVLKILG